MEYYSEIKKNQLLIHAKTWVNSKNSMLSARGQSQKISYCMILYEISRKDETIETESRSVVAWDWGKGKD